MSKSIRQLRKFRGTRQKPITRGEIIRKWLFGPKGFNKDAVDEIARRERESKKRQERPKITRGKVVKVILVKCAKLAAKPPKFLLEKCADPASISPSSFNPEKRNILKRASFSKQ